MLLAGEIERFPGTPGQHHPVHVDFVLNHDLHVVVGVFQRAVDVGQEQLIGLRDVFASRRLDKLLPDRFVGLDFGRFDFGKPVGMLAGTAAHGPRIAVQHLEYRQGALLLGQFLGHGEGGGQGHEGVVAINAAIASKRLADRKGQHGHSPTGGRQKGRGGSRARSRSLACVTGWFSMAQANNTRYYFREPK